jgi:hypothetical protein
MSAITNISDLINRATGGNSGTPETMWVYKDARDTAGAATAPIVGRISSMFAWIGTQCHGTYPTSAAYPTRATAGALGQANPGGGREKWLVGVAASASQMGTLILYDRLAHIGNLSGTATGAQTVNLTLSGLRYSAGTGVQIWLEIHTQIGASSTTITASYTNQAGTSGQTTQATAWGNTNFREKDRIVILPLASGDSGVQAVASVTAAATTGTAGAFGVVLVRPLLYIPISGSSLAVARDLVTGLPSLQKIETDACLAWAWVATVATAPQVVASVHSVEA